MLEAVPQIRHESKFIYDLYPPVLRRNYNELIPTNRRKHNIRKEIKERRKLNKIHRNWREDEEGREDAWEAYQWQKSKVKELISKEMKQYEENLTEEIRSGGRKGALWEVVNKLRGINKEKEAMKLYNEEGKMVSGMEVERLVAEYWSKIYKTHENRMGKIWTEEGRREYEE